MNTYSSVGQRTTTAAMPSSRKKMPCPMPKAPKRPTGGIINSLTKRG